MLEVVAMEAPWSILGNEVHRLSAFIVE